VRSETSTLLAALHDLDGDLVEIMLGLLTDELSAEKQRQFGRLFVAAGKLLEEHAELTMVSTEIEAPGNVPTSGDSP
jgi:hypothetical protein